MKQTAEKPTYREAVKTRGACADGVRERVLADFRAAGGQREAWTRSDGNAMARAMTAEEDRLELLPGSVRAADRLRLQAVRRRLESDS